MVILPDALMEKAKKRARKEHSTLTHVLEQALRDYLDKPPAKRAAPAFTITPFQGNGYVTRDLEGNWDQIRDIIYDRPSR